MNTIQPYWIDNRIQMLQKDKQKKKKEGEEQYIEVGSRFKDIFNSELFSLGPSKFLTMLRKKR